MHQPLRPSSCPTISLPAGRHPVDADGGGARESAAAAEFIAAMHEYRQRSGRLFPTWSEVLEVARGLGYVKGGSPVAAGA